MNEDDFKSLLGDDVEPIKNEKRVLTNKAAGKSHDINALARKTNATDFEASEQDPLDTSSMTMVQPLDLLEFKRPGVQNGVYRNMRLGKYPIEARLDLHRLTVEQARTSLYRFVSDCVEHDIRYVIVTHGKGEGRETPALLKSCVAHWLPQIEEVLAFHTAQKHHGSYGATYVLFRKTESKKQETREQYR